MFEDSTFESANRIHTRSRTWSVVAFTFNGLILAALVVIPLIYPEALPSQFKNILLTVPPPPPAAPKPIVPQRALARPATQIPDGHMFAPRRIPATITMIATPEPPLGDVQQIPGAASGPGNGDNPGAIFTGRNERPVVQAAPKGPIIISGGVAEGRLLQKVVPHYPPIAVASRTQGTVVLQAVISKLGAIQDLHVVSGSPLLTQAAIDAVSQWRYRPYLLNGEPVAVETTIKVVFSLNQ